MTGLRAFTRAGSRACAVRRGRRGQTAAGLRPQPRHPPAANLHSGGPTRAHRHHGPVRHSRSRESNNGGTSRDGNDRPGARSVPSRFQARSGPTVCRGEGQPPRLGIIEAGRVWRQPWCPRPRTPSRRRPLHRQARSTVTATLPSLVNIDYWQVEAAKRMLDVLGFPPGAHQERNHGERHMPDEHDRSGIEVDRADRQVIEQAAAQLRHGAIPAATRDWSTSTSRWRWRWCWCWCSTSWPCGCREPGHLMRPARTRGRGRRAGLVGARGWPPRNVAGCRLRAGADPVIGAGGGC